MGEHLKDWKSYAAIVALVAGVGGGGGSFLSQADTTESLDTLTERTAQMEKKDSASDSRIQKNADSISDIKGDIKEINVRIEKLDDIEDDVEESKESMIRQEMMIQELTRWLQRNQTDTGGGHP